MDETYIQTHVVDTMQTFEDVISSIPTMETITACDLRARSLSENKTCLHDASLESLYPRLEIVIPAIREIYKGLRAREDLSFIDDHSVMIMATSGLSCQEYNAKKDIFDESLSVSTVIARIKPYRQTHCSFSHDTHDTILHSLRLNRDKRDNSIYYGGSSSRVRIPEDKQKALEKLISSVNAQVKSIIDRHIGVHYEYNGYYGYVRKNHPMYLAWKGEIPLTPEAFTSCFDHSLIVDHSKSFSSEPDVYSGQFYVQGKDPLIGYSWNVNTIITAIKEAAAAIGPEALTLKLVGIDSDYNLPGFGVPHDGDMETETRYNDYKKLKSQTYKKLCELDEMTRGGFYGCDSDFYGSFFESEFKEINSVFWYRRKTKNYYIYIYSLLVKKLLRMKPQESLLEIVKRASGGDRVQAGEYEVDGLKVKVILSGPGVLSATPEEKQKSLFSGGYIAGAPK